MSVNVDYNLNSDQYFKKFRFSSKYPLCRILHLIHLHNLMFHYPCLDVFFLQFLGISSTVL